MAKKKATEETPIIDNDLVIKGILKKYGDGVIAKADYLVDTTPKIIPVCPSIDRVFGGGITVGSWCAFVGTPKTGKTSSALHFAGNCQKHGMKAFFLNVEGRLKERDIKGIQNLDYKSLEVIKSTKDNILSGETWLEILDDLLNSTENCVFIVDSFSRLVPSAKMAEYGKQTRGSSGVMIGDFCERNANVVPLRNHIIVGMIHIYSNTGGGMSTTSEKIASSLAYQIDFKLRTTWSPPWTIGSDENSEQIGNKIQYKCLFSGLRGGGRKCETLLRYGIGIDEVAENVNFAIDFNLINKGGSWYTIFADTEREFKVQGIEGIYDYFRAEEHKEDYNLLAAQVRELIL